ncbi:MAG TPA: hypothetical protein VGF52_01115 [Tepidisphaeraceae bacterium]|jgi:hypothetical protein
MNNTQLKSTMPLPLAPSEKTLCAAAACNRCCKANVSNKTCRRAMVAGNDNIDSRDSKARQPTNISRGSIA